MQPQKIAIIRCWNVNGALQSPIWITWLLKVHWENDAFPFWVDGLEYFLECDNLGKHNVSHNVYSNSEY